MLRNKIYIFFILIVSVCSNYRCYANSPVFIDNCNSGQMILVINDSDVLDSVVIADDTTSATNYSEPQSRKRIISITKERKEKLMALALAFPLPLGILGAHRIYMGCKPYVPVIYIATLGGCFGILPLIDFAIMAGSNDLSPFENNNKVFMWLK